MGNYTKKNTVSLSLSAGLLDALIDSLLFDDEDEVRWELDNNPLGLTAVILDDATVEIDAGATRLELDLATEGGVTPMDVVVGLPVDATGDVSDDKKTAYLRWTPGAVDSVVLNGTPLASSDPRFGAIASAVDGAIQGAGVADRLVFELDLTDLTAALELDNPAWTIAVSALPGHDGFLDCFGVFFDHDQQATSSSRSSLASGYDFQFAITGSVLQARLNVETAKQVGTKAHKRFYYRSLSANVDGDKVRIAGVVQRKRRRGRWGRLRAKISGYATVAYNAGSGKMEADTSHIRVRARTGIMMLLSVLVPQIALGITIALKRVLRTRAESRIDDVVKKFLSGFNETLADAFDGSAEFEVRSGGLRGNDIVFDGVVRGSL